MDDPIADECEHLEHDLALLRRLLANVRPDEIAVLACTEVMRERYARLEELVRGEHASYT